jgi:hypothetical protein
MIALVLRHMQAHDPLLQLLQGQFHQRHQLEAESFLDEQLALEQAVLQDYMPWAQGQLIALQT